MKVIGLTGGIGSGKSEAQRYLTSKKIPVIDADRISRDIVKPGSEVLMEITDAFGANIILEDGSLDRKALGKIVFSNKEKLDILNNIMHKRILNEIKHQLALIKAPLVVIDAPLLIETGLYKIVDEVWVIDLETHFQIERVKMRDNLSENEIKKRIHSQLPREERKKYAHVIINNSGTIESLYLQIDQQLNR
ncbi:MAG: dephospho-CoA kinase, partial [Clostridia bacterium]|nr:dephospho-CoA kinase [Clostridia bacterium]